MIKQRKTVLITGASGMLGLKLIAVLGRKYKIIALYHGNGQQVNGFKKFAADIGSAKAVAALQKQIEKVDVVIHCAAVTEVNKCELNPAQCRRVNIIGTKNVRDLTSAYGAKLIYISTPMIFSGKTGNYKEGSRARPLNLYGQTKLQAEKIVARYPASLIIRSNPIGVRPPGAHPSFIQWFVERARKNEPFTLFSDVVINPLSTKTLTEILIRIVDHFKPGVLHLGSRDRANKTEIWQYIVKKFPKFDAPLTNLSVAKTEVARIANRPREMWLNVSRAERFGYRVPSWKREVAAVLRELKV